MLTTVSPHKVTRTSLTIYLVLPDGGFGCPVKSSQSIIVRLPNGKKVVGSEVLETQHEEDGNYKIYKSVSF